MSKVQLSNSYWAKHLKNEAYYTINIDGFEVKYDFTSNRAHNKPRAVSGKLLSSYIKIIKTCAKNSETEDQFHQLNQMLDSCLPGTVESVCDEYLQRVKNGQDISMYNFLYTYLSDLSRQLGEPVNWLLFSHNNYFS